MPKILYFEMSQQAQLEIVIVSEAALMSGRTKRVVATLSYQYCKLNRKSTIIVVLTLTTIIDIHPHILRNCTINNSSRKENLKYV